MSIDGSYRGIVGIKSADSSTRKKNYLLNLIRLLGMGTPRSKYLPEWFAFEPVSVREHLVAGLVDSDGHVVPSTQEHGEEGNGDEEAELVTDNDNGFNEAKHLYQSVIVVSIYLPIARGLYAVAHSLGIPIYGYTKDPFINKNGCSIKYTYYMEMSPCDATTKILSRLSIGYKRRQAPTIVKRVPVECRFEVVEASLPNVIKDLQTIKQIRKVEHDETAAPGEQKLALCFQDIAQIAKAFSLFGPRQHVLAEKLEIHRRIRSSYVNGVTDNAKATEHFRMALIENFGSRWWWFGT